MRRLNDRQIFVAVALLFPFLSTLGSILFPSLFAPIAIVAKLLDSGIEKVTTQLEISNNIRVAIVVYSLAVIPGLLCLLRVIKKPVDRLVYGLLYLLFMLPLLYIWLLIIGLIRSGYL